MPYKPIKRYRVAYFASGSKAGKTEIVVVLEDGGSYTFDNLPPDAAHHMVDLLRNEKPIYLNPDTGTLAVLDEPVGAGE
jgi:hypothetical protein